MFNYKSTEQFDIGSGRGEYEYDFFMINSEDDFSALINHYATVYKRFDYFLDDYKTVENNTHLSPVIQTKMKEHNANLCLTFLEEEFKKKNMGIRKMIVNEQKPNGTYKTYSFSFYYAATKTKRDYIKLGSSYAKSGLHNAAIGYFSHAIQLDPGYGCAFIARGNSYMEIKIYDKAIEDFTQAINLNTKSSYVLRGLAYKVTGDLDKVKADFTKALELNPGDEIAKECLEEINKA